MRYLTILLLLVTLTGCSRGMVVQKIDPTEVSRVILTYSSKMKRENHLILGDSVVYYENRINRIRLDYTSQEVVPDLWRAREILVDLVEGLLDRINSNELIVPQLRDNPFTADNLEVFICFENFYGKYIDLQNSALITLRSGQANYYTNTATDCNQDCWEKRNEFYWQSKMFTEFHRQGEFIYGPKEPEPHTYFELERHIPDKHHRSRPHTKDRGTGLQFN